MEEGHFDEVIVSRDDKEIVDMLSHGRPGSNLMPKKHLMSLNYESKKYGIGQIIRVFAFYPKWLPLPCHWEHGWTALPLPLNSDLESPKKIMLVNNKDKFDTWKKNSNNYWFAIYPI